MTEIGKRIRYFRRLAGMSQAEMSKKLHVDRSAVSHWERGRGEPKGSILEKIAAACGVEMRIFWGEIELDSTADEA